MLYTDGLTEARNKNGELFGDERLKALFASRPTAHQAAEAAIEFGQDDDVTVVSLTRLDLKVVSSSSLEHSSAQATAIGPGEAPAAAIS